MTHLKRNVIWYIILTMLISSFVYFEMLKDELETEKVFVERYNPHLPDVEMLMFDMYRKATRKYGFDFDGLVIEPDGTFTVKLRNSQDLHYTNSVKLMEELR